MLLFLSFEVRLDCEKLKDNHALVSLLIMSNLQERQSLEEERHRVEALKRRCEEKEKLIPSQPESQREQLTLQLQQVSG